MNMFAFLGAPASTSSSFCGSSLSHRVSTCATSSFRAPTAELKLVPGVPPGEDARDNAPMRYYVPRPVETYEERGFATILPKTWEGEIDTIGAPDIPPLTKESIEASKFVKVDSVSTGAFLEYAQMMKSERQASLLRLEERRAIPQVGRATCGLTEGRETVSNYVEILVDGVKAVEYWGKPNGEVPRLFGGPGE